MDLSEEGGAREKIGEGGHEKEVKRKEVCGRM